MINLDTGIFGLDLLLNTLNFITQLSATGTETGEQGNLHVGGTNTPGERDEAEGGEGGTMMTIVNAEEQMMYSKITNGT